MIRRITQTDADALATLLAESSEAAQWSAASLIVPGDSELQVLVSEQDNEVAGMLAFRTVAEEGEILNVAVARRWRRRSLGSELLKAAVGQLRASGANRIFLEVRESNAAARAFYSRMKFVEHGRRAAYYRNPVEDAILLSLRVG